MPKQNLFSKLVFTIDRLVPYIEGYLVSQSALADSNRRLNEEALKDVVSARESMNKIDKALEDMRPQSKAGQPLDGHALKELFKQP